MSEPKINECSREMSERELFFRRCSTAESVATMASAAYLQLKHTVRDTGNTTVRVIVQVIEPTQA